MLLFASLLALASAPAQLYIEPSVLAPKIAALLREELGAAALADDEEQARFRLSMRAEHRELALVLTSTSGAIVLERRIALAGGEKPALRAAVLAVQQAIAAESALALEIEIEIEHEHEHELEQEHEQTVIDRPPLIVDPPPLAKIEERAPERSPELAATPEHAIALRAGAGATLVAEPRAPQLTLELSAHYSLLDSLDLGLALTTTGILPKTTAPGLKTRWLVFEALALADYAFPLAAGPMHLGAQAGVGYEHQSLEANPDEVFVGTATAQNGTANSGTARLAISVALELPAELRARLFLGGHLRTQPLSTALPDNFPLGTARFDSGIFTPYMTLTLEHRLF